MSGAAGDLIARYLAELGAGLGVPPTEAELILAEAEDHLRETAAAGLAVGMTELEAQQASISSFGPVRAVVRAHCQRTAMASDAAMAAWKLIALLATTVGAGGIAGLGIFAFLLPSGPAWATGVQVVPVSAAACQCSVNMVTIISPAVAARPYAAIAAGGLALLATRRLARRDASGRDPLTAAVTANFFLLVTALLFAVNVSGAGADTNRLTWTTPISEGSVSPAPAVPGAVVAACLAVAVGYGAQAALRRARRRPGSGALCRVPGQADRGGAGRAYV